MQSLCNALLRSVALGALLLLVPLVARAQSHVAYSFCNPGKCTDGSDADGTLTEVNGALFGLTWEGGTYHAGTAYSFDRSTGVEAVLHSFGNGTDGSNPFGGLIDVNGTLYGTTSDGGDTSCSMDCGTVFSLDPGTGKEKVLYSFCTDYPYCRDGSEPNGILIDVNGTLYGTTATGGAHGRGEVFSLDPGSSTETVVYSFSGTDGEAPDSLIDVNQTLYGTTAIGGNHDCGGIGCGVVFSLDPDTGAATTLYTFTGAIGSGPENLIDLNGTIYGVAYAGGAGPCTDFEYGNGCGTVFSFDPGSGTAKVLYSFCGQANCTDGAYPLSLVEVHGLLYGTAQSGGTADQGIVFSVDPGTGKETVVYSFCGRTDCRDGQYPDPGLLKSKGRLYGTTTYGGRGGEGVIFFIKMP